MTWTSEPPAVPGPPKPSEEAVYAVMLAAYDAADISAADGFSDHDLMWLYAAALVRRYPGLTGVIPEGGEK